MKLKIGQKVKVRRDLEKISYHSSENNESNAVMSEMMGLRGEIVTIKDYDDGQYHIVEGSYRWVDTMFEPLEDDFDKNLVDTAEIANAFNTILMQ